MLRNHWSRETTARALQIPYKTQTLGLISFILTLQITFARHQSRWLSNKPMEIEIHCEHCFTSKCRRRWRNFICISPSVAFVLTRWKLCSHEYFSLLKIQPRKLANIFGTLRSVETWKGLLSYNCGWMTESYCETCLLSGDLFRRPAQEINLLMLIILSSSIIPTIFLLSFLNRPGRTFCFIVSFSLQTFKFIVSDVYSAFLWQINGRRMDPNLSAHRSASFE